MSNAFFRTKKTYFSGTIFLTASKTSAVSTLLPNSFSRCSRRIPCRHNTQLKYEASLSQIILMKSSLFPYLISCSDDKHPSQNEALAVHVALETGPPGPNEVLPHPEANEPQTPHLPLQRAVKAFLQSHSLVLVR